jgi:hypothetical protein
LYIRVIRKVTLSSPYLWASLHSLSPVAVVLQSYEILLNLNMKCWNSAFNAQGLRLIIVVVQLGAVEAFRKKERQDETQFTTKIDCFLSFIPRWMLMYLFVCWFFFNLTVYDQTQGSGAMFSYFTDNSVINNYVIREWQNFRSIWF